MAPTLLGGFGLKIINTAMVRIEFLCICSYQSNRSSYSKSQAREVFGDHDNTMVENTVLVSHVGIITDKFSDTSSSKYSNFTIRKITEAPALSEKNYWAFTY